LTGFFCKTFSNFILSLHPENPVLCDELLPELSSAMDMYHARLSGVAHCIVPQDINIDSSVLMQPPITFNKLLTPQQIMIPRDASILLQPPSIVQIILPSNMVKKEMLAMENVRQEIENERKDAKIITPDQDEDSEEIDDKDEIPADEIPADEASEQTNDANEQQTNNLTTNATTTTTTVSTSTTTSTESTILATDTVAITTTPDMNKNLIHETFSPSPIEIVAPPLDRALSLSQASGEEPPEATAPEDHNMAQLTI
jgi:hypothetical protein